MLAESVAVFTTEIFGSTLESAFERPGVDDAETNMTGAPLEPEALAGAPPPPPLEDPELACGEFVEPVEGLPPPPPPPPPPPDELEEELPPPPPPEFEVELPPSPPPLPPPEGGGVGLGEGGGGGGGAGGGELPPPLPEPAAAETVRLTCFVLSVLS